MGAGSKPEQEAPGALVLTSGYGIRAGCRAGAQRAAYWLWPLVDPDAVTPERLNEIYELLLPTSDVI